MKGGAPAHGFTIVETMIYLAVTGVLLVSAMALMNGRQANTEFQQGIHQVVSNLQDIVSSVSTGFYPSLEDFNCDTGADGTSATFTISGTGPVTEQGTNTGCLYLGRAIQFAPDSSDVSQGKYAYVVYTVASRQYKRGQDPPQPVTTLTDAQPTAIYPVPGERDTNTNPGDAQIFTLPYGISVAWVKYGVGSPPAVPVGTIIWLTDLNGGIESVGTNATNGSENIYLGALQRSTTGQSRQQAARLIDQIDQGYLVQGTATSNLEVEVCFASGSTEQSGLVTMGENGNPASISLQIKNGTNC